MNSRLLSAAVCVAVSLGCACCGQSAPRPLVLSEGNAAKYAVVVPDVAEKPGFSFALADMTNLLSRASGAAFPVVPRSASPATRRLFVGIVPDGETAPKDGEYAVRVRGDDLYMFGGGAHGTRYAIYEFLENSAGFRFYDMRGGMKVPDGRVRLSVTPCEVPTTAEGHPLYQELTAWGEQIESFFDDYPCLREVCHGLRTPDRNSTRLNSSHD